MWRAPANHFHCGRHLNMILNVTSCLESILLVTDDIISKIIFFLTTHDFGSGWTKVRENLYHRNSPTSEKRWLIVWWAFFFEVIKNWNDSEIKSRETIHISSGYQEAENFKRIEGTEKLGHTQLVPQFLSWILMFVPWVKIIIATTVSILLPDDEFVPEEVNSCTKVWLGRCNRLCIWGKARSEQNES